MKNNLRIYRAIENDKYNPSLELAFKIAHKFDVKIEDIFISEI